MSKILIIDDEPAIIDVIRERLEVENFAAQAAMDRASALARIRDFHPNLVLLDIFLGGENGLEVLKTLRREYPALPVIIMTGQPNSELCLEALRLGANQFIPKPLDLDNLISLIRRLTADIPASAHGVFQEDAFVGKSPAILDLTQAVWKAAQSQADTLLIGENGTGKDLAARIIHRLGPRSQRPFYTIYLPSVPDTLFESELFGTEPGAFNNARARKGRVEEAEGGVLLLNEIGDINGGQQVKLLEFLGEKAYVRVGGNERRRADVQILICTNRNLEERVRDGYFREDLYYRLCSNVVRVPLLRERLEDIPELVAHLIKKHRGDKPIQGIDPELLAEFQRLPWEGNVRELENYIQQGIQHCPDTLIRRSDIPYHKKSGKPGELLESSANWDSTWDEFQSRLDQLTCQFLRYHLKQHHGYVTEAARSLGISRENLSYKIRILGLKGDPTA